MAKCRDLLQRARTSPTSLRFREAQRLAECFGFELARIRGSHHIYRSANSRAVVNLQERAGMAKPYQVRQLLMAIADSDLPGQEDDDDRPR